MPAEQLDALRLLLGAIVVMAGCYFLVPDDSPKVERPKGRDFAKEHALGAHRHTPPWGCPECRK